MKSDVSISDKKLQITRFFGAPRRIVFGWWSSAEKLQQWSGCKGATGCEVKMDFRVGGSFSQKMRIAGAGEFSFSGTYDEIIEPERIVYRAHFGPVTTRVTVEFFEQDSGTNLVLTHEGFPDEFFCKNVAQGTGESFDKLAELVVSQAVPSHQ